MAKVKSPLRFSRHFGVAPARMRKLGVFDPVLQADTKLFIDPVLLRHSGASEISGLGNTTLKSFFATIYKLLAASRRPGMPNITSAARSSVPTSRHRRPAARSPGA